MPCTPSATLQVSVRSVGVPSTASGQEEGGLALPCWSSRSKGETDVTSTKMVSERRDGMTREQGAEGPHS